MILPTSGARVETAEEIRDMGVEYSVTPYTRALDEMIRDVCLLRARLESNRNNCMGYLCKNRKEKYD